MKKQEFISDLKAKLSFLPKADVEERLAFYSEMIDDKVEEGIREEEAIAEIGPAQKLVEQIISDTPLIKIAKEKIRPKRKLKAWEITMLCIGSAIWVPLLIATLAVIFSLYAALWSIAVSVIAVFVSLAACAPAGFIVSLICIFSSDAFTGFYMMAIAFVSAGLAIFMFYASKAIIKAMILFTKLCVRSLKNLFC